MVVGDGLSIAYAIMSTVKRHAPLEHGDHEVHDEELTQYHFVGNVLAAIVRAVYERDAAGGEF